VLWQRVVLCKSYGAENAPDCGCVSCVMLSETGYGCVSCVMLSETGYGCVSRVMLSETVYGCVS